MGMTSFYTGSLRYDIHGRKRKTTSMKKSRKLQTEFKPYKPEKTYAQLQMEDFNKKYKSMPMTNTYTPAQDESWKAEESKNFTIAPAYNKGAYQVINKNNIKDIGR